MSESDNKSVGAEHQQPHTPTKSIGIRKVEVLSAQYGDWKLRILLFISIFFVAYTYSIDATFRSLAQPLATASYAEHSLMSTVNVIRGVVAAAAQPTYARLSDRFGRLELFLLAIVFYVIGTIIQSQATNVNKFAGGAVMYQIGYTGVIAIIQIILADFSNLNWRLTASFIPALPFIINTWVSGDMTSSLYAHHGWSYSVWIFAIIFPCSCIPLVLCFIHMHIKARSTEEWQAITEEESLENEKTHKWNSFTDNVAVKYFWDLDIVGILLIICVLGFILVPFTLAGGIHDNWKKASTIAPLVIGFVLIPVFIVWEGEFAKTPIIPFPLLKDRGVWSALIIAIFIDLIWYMPNDYMYTVLIVGMNASVKAATRIVSLYSFVSVITGPLVGLLVVKVRRVKGFIVFGVVMWLVALGILLHFRGDNDGTTESQKFLDGVIGGLCLMGFGAGFFTYSTQVSISSVTSHEHMATVLCLYLSFYNIGMAIGASVSGAIWTNKMPGYLNKEFLKLGLTQELADSAYSDPFSFIVTYPWGSSARIAVVQAYAETQRLLCIVGLVLCVPLLATTLFLRDHKLDNVQSLELVDPEKAIEEEKKGEVVVNNYDEDYIVRFLKKLVFRK
ncbi:siderophore transporter [Saccharomycopsis crataegensis]|uniref:Siderophore transporter n=1 Tax=Saccharomycopsis crataegensis TaxID=43959 RepID=A0AAV5QSQ2_9ASCO|nr:siderophore transporter [Saccharomycopsis crataegensis]